MGYVEPQIKQTCILLDCSGEPKYTGLSPGTFSLWGTSANHQATVLLNQP